MEEAIHADNSSVVKITAVQINRDQARERAIVADQAPVPEKETNNSFIVALIILLIIIGVSVPAGLYLLRKSTPQVSQIEVPTTSSIINTTTEKKVDIGNLHKKEITEKLLQERQKQDIAFDSTLGISFTQNANPVSTEMFFTLLDSLIPPSFVRSLNKDFAFGFYNTKGNQPYFIFKVADYSNAFEGILAWEKSMAKDIGGFFFLNSDNPTVYDPDYQPQFEDSVIQNKDIRVLKTRSGDISVFYSFIDRSTIVITTNEEAFKALIAGIETKQTAR